MKTLQYYLDNVNKSEENSDYVDIVKIAEVVDFLYAGYYEELTELKCYWAFHWVCTDTWVGLRLYYLNDEFVCYSFQSARRASESFYWVSKESREKVRNVIIEKIDIENKTNFELID